MPTSEFDRTNVGQDDPEECPKDINDYRFFKAGLEKGQSESIEEVGENYLETESDIDDESPSKPHLKGPTVRDENVKTTGELKE